MNAWIRRWEVIVDDEDKTLYTWESMHIEEYYSLLGYLISSLYLCSLLLLSAVSGFMRSSVSGRACSCLRPKKIWLGLFPSDLAMFLHAAIASGRFSLAACVRVTRLFMFLSVFSDLRIMLKVFWCSSSQVQATPFRSGGRCHLLDVRGRERRSPVGLPVRGMHVDACRGREVLYCGV